MCDVKVPFIPADNLGLKGSNDGRCLRGFLVKKKNTANRAVFCLI